MCFLQFIRGLQTNGHFIEFDLKAINYYIVLISLVARDLIDIQHYLLALLVYSCQKYRDIGCRESKLI